MGLDTERFERELAEHTHAHRVNEDVRRGLESGGEGTPTFFVNGLQYEGPNDLATPWAALKETAR